MISCSPDRVRTTDLTEKQGDEIVDGVQQTLYDYFGAIERAGLTAEFAYLDNSPEFFWVPPGYSEAISYDSVEAILKQSAPRYRSVVNTWNTLRIIPLHQTLATYTGQLTSVMTDTSGVSNTIELVETGVVIKRKDGWKLLCGQTAVMTNTQPKETGQ